MGHRVFGGVSYWQWAQLSVQLRHMQLPAGDSESICCFPFAPGAGDLPLILPSLLGRVQDPGMEEMLRIRLELQVGNRPQESYTEHLLGARTWGVSVHIGVLRCVWEDHPLSVDARTAALIDPALCAHT